ncbi:MAG: hypothetical protein R6X16_01015 [Anaerolineae bacterium]|jgi:hypothetical protein
MQKLNCDADWRFHLGDPPGAPWHAYPKRLRRVNAVFLGEAP